jgi:hypothetical protein
MMNTEIRQGLSDLREAVDVPPLDPSGFDARVRHHRRRRLAGRIAAGVATLTIVAVVAAAAPAVLHRSSPTPVAAPASDPGVPVTLDGRVELVGSDGTVTDTGLRGTPVGRIDGRLVVLDGHQLIGLADDPITGVASAYVGEEGATYQTTDGRIVFTGTGGQSSAQDEGTLLAAADPAYVADAGDGPVIHESGGLHPIELGSDGARVRADRVEAGGDTVVFVADGGVQVFDTSGVRRDGFLGGTTGALSGDGTTYAFAPSADELAGGMSAGLVRYDTSTGAHQRVPLQDPAVTLAWYDRVPYVVTEAQHVRTLWRCADTCARVLTDGSGTLTLGR